MNVFKLIAVCTGAGAIIIQSLFIADNHYSVVAIKAKQTVLTESIETISSKLDELQVSIDNVHESRTRQVDETALALEELQQAQENLESSVSKVKNFLNGSSANFQ